MLTFLPWKNHDVWTLACSAGVLFGRANVISSRSFIQPIMFVDGGGWGVGAAKGKIFTTPPLPLSLFLTGDRPLGTNFFLSPAFCWHLKKTWRPQFLVRKYWVLARQNCACCAGYWNCAYFLQHVQSAKGAFRAYFKVCYSCYEY